MVIEQHNINRITCLMTIKTVTCERRPKVCSIRCHRRWQLCHKLYGLLFPAQFATFFNLKSHCNGHVEHVCHYEF